MSIVEPHNTFERSNKTRPPHEEGDRYFGIFSHFETFSVEMKFEQAGLRTRTT